MRRIVRARGEKSASPDVAVARLAARQHAVVSRRQLLALGLGRDAVAHRLRCGRLHRVHAGVYTVGHTLELPYTRFMAAVLAGGPGTVLSHRSAAALWGMRAAAGDVEVSRLRAGGGGRRGIRVHSTRSLPAPEVAVEGGIPCTAPARTLVDLAAVLDRRRLRRALERSLELRILDGRALGAALAGARGRRGTGVLRRLVAELPDEAPPVRSELERRFLELVREAGLPLPAVNARVAGHDVDFHWPAEGLIVETDGRATHDTARQFEEDRRRDVQLTLAGWHVVRVGWRQVTRDPARVEALLRARLRRGRRGPIV